MKAKKANYYFFLLCAIAITALAQEAPIKDFRLPNDELVTIFIGENNWRAPYIQSVDFVNDNFIFNNLYENASQSVDHSSDIYYPSCGTNGNFDADNETTELILGSQSNNKIVLQHAICELTGIDQITTLSSSITQAYNPCIVSGYFTPESKLDNCKEVVFATQWDDFGEMKYYMRMNGFRFTTAGNEEIHRFYQNEINTFFSVINGFFSPVDAVVCDFDGDSYDEVCYIFGYYTFRYNYNLNRVSKEEIYVGSFDWTKQGESSIAFPFGSPHHQTIKSWINAETDFISPLFIFHSRHLFRISAGDINNDGKDEIVVFRNLRYDGGYPPDDYKSGFEILVFTFDTDTKEWSQLEIDNMKGTLLDKDTPFTHVESRDWDYDNIQLKVGDLDNNGCCDIAASLSYKTSTKECMHYWIYTFDLDAVEGLVAKEELNDKKENTGLKHSMAITNMDGDKYSEIYYVTEKPKLYAVTYDTARKEFRAIEEKSTSSNNYNSSAHGFTWPVIIPVDIDNDSYWCRYKRYMFDSQETTPFIGKPVAIITPPPYQEEINPNTHIEIKFKTAHDTLASVQIQTGYGYDFEISAGVKWLGTKTIFETIYDDTVMDNKENYVANSDNDYWDCHKNATQVIFPTSGYDIYPYRIESFTGDPIKSDTGEDLFLYIFKPKDSGTHLETRTWENYLIAFEESYGTEEKNKIVNFMSPFMQNTPGDIATFMNNSNPYFIYPNLDKVFPTMEQEINTSFTQFQKEWGKTNRTDESCKRSRRWENKIDLRVGHDWGIVSAKAELKFYNFTTTKEMTGSTDEDGVLIKLNFQGVGEPNTNDDNKYYKVTSYAFWGPKEVGLDGAIIVSHQVTEIGSYYRGTAINTNQDRLPEEFSLEQNYPNPFNPTTSISYALPSPSKVLISVYNVNGQLVSELFKGKRQAGYHSLTWDASENTAGTYFIKMVAGKFVQTRKCVLLK